jgi:hypothetical protein
MNELLERFKEPLNQFWNRMLVVCGSIATLAIAITDILPTVLQDEYVPDEYKTPIRMVYSIFLGISIAAKLTRK